MKQENTVLYILRLTVTLLLICAFVALALAGVNAITKDKIAAVKAAKTAKAISAVLKNGSVLPLPRTAVASLRNAFFDHFN